MLNEKPSDSGHSQNPMAISLLEELLKLDWRKRINAIDAINHPYFSSPPFPARPGELPSFEDSHEFDRRRFRGQRGAIPPAPAGGSVGMGPNSGWTSNSGSRPTTDNRNSRIPGASRVGRLPPHGVQNHPTKRPFENRNAVSHGPSNAGESFPGFSGSKDCGLPPKPPVSAHPSWSMGYSNRATREKGQRNHFGGWPDGKLDSYIPTYSDASGHSRERKGNSPGSIVDRRDLELEHSNEGHKQGHPWDRCASRKRSRSPDFRAARTEDRALYRR